MPPFIDDAQDKYGAQHNQDDLIISTSTCHDLRDDRCEGKPQQQQQQRQAPQNPYAKVDVAKVPPTTMPVKTKKNKSN